MDKQTVCEKKTTLLAGYQRITQRYSEAVAELNRIIGISPKEDYDALYRITEALRFDAMEAQDTLQNHIVEHGC